jgi:hypothetical protein
MTIESAEKFKASFWDYGRFNKCFYPTNIRISDVDGFAYIAGDRIQYKAGFVHRKAHFLLLENKDHDGVPIKDASIIAHTDLVQLNFTIIYLWGQANCFPVERMRIWRSQQARPQDDELDVTESRLCEAIRNWFLFADAHPADPREIMRQFQMNTPAVLQPSTSRAALPIAERLRAMNFDEPHIEDEQQSWTRGYQ